MGSHSHSANLLLKLTVDIQDGSLYAKQHDQTLNARDTSLRSR
jgi:hypothetical protein